MGKQSVYTGKRYGRLTAVFELVARSKYGRRQFLCQCECGECPVVLAENLSSGHTESCGCLAKERTSLDRRTHGHSYAKEKKQTPEYKSWSGMLQRCTNPKSSRYDRYGGRGITVCERWQRFENFLADMGERPPSHSLDRIDPQGNYEPKNCRWADDFTQQNNRSNNRILTVNGESLTVGQWAKKSGIRLVVICLRLRKGWTSQEAVSRPLRSELKTISQRKESKCQD